jgi:hypothetical protein
MIKGTWDYRMTNQNDSRFADTQVESDKGNIGAVRLN